MDITFYKYQGTGNDFVMIDNRDLKFPKDNTKLVAFLCDRRFGVGADGLILLEKDTAVDFKMVYYNSDGNESTMCGNGGRCIVAFAEFLNVFKKETTFNAVDGLHNAIIEGSLVSLQMLDVDEIKTKPNAMFLNTGSPHHVQEVVNLSEFRVKEEGKKLRYGLYGEAGSNINFVESVKENVFAVRTYERGVEDETLSCGTGVTAAAIAMHKSGKVKSNHVFINVLGGNLEVKFSVNDAMYSDVFLIGDAKQVYKGEIVCNI
ncbi:diaminopimelate epimerase [Maribacter vaceletii]|uniref:Diaminopimelate epimerase n=1 Tax=Maribacter vaceletii TaxID=1206816 RepID=A0A495E9N9_9FLAO|nr:diaminopimelate epimerase [Maribacter vaceletii]RKR13411.1 diaminopimelate epimerase [Maribacter vaceletii]